MPKPRTRGQSIAGRTACISRGFGPSLTNQEYASHCEPREVVRRWIKTGQLDWTTAREQFFADTTETPTYLEALETISRVEDFFDELPVKTRSHFDNNPELMLAFMQKHPKHEDLQTLGLHYNKPEPIPAANAAPAVPANPATPEPTE